MSNGLLQYKLKVFNRIKIRGYKKYICLDPNINIRKIYNFYMKNREYYKLHYIYLYWINLSLVDKYDG